VSGLPPGCCAACLHSDAAPAGSVCRCAADIGDAPCRCMLFCSQAEAAPPIGSCPLAGHKASGATGLPGLQIQHTASKGCIHMRCGQLYGWRTEQENLYKPKHSMHTPAGGDAKAEAAAWPPLHWADAGNCGRRARLHVRVQPPAAQCRRCLLTQRQQLPQYHPASTDLVHVTACIGCQFKCGHSIMQSFNAARNFLSKQMYTHFERGH
jgi:hypothetical protein